MRYTPPSTREQGLEKALGTELYQLFVAEYQHQMAKYKKVKPALFVEALDHRISRTSVYKYVLILEDELADDKPADT